MNFNEANGIKKTLSLTTRVTKFTTVNRTKQSDFLFSKNISINKPLNEGGIQLFEHSQLPLLIILQQRLPMLGTECTVCFCIKF